MSVYFARVKGYVKIGYSADPYQRIETLTAGSCIKPDDVSPGDPVDMMGWIPGDRSVERATHHHFGSLYLTGEWFWDDDSIDAFLADHEYAVLPHDLPGLVVFLMLKYPNVPRAKVLEVYQNDRAEKLADPTSGTAQAMTILDVDDAWVERINKDAANRRAAERAYWRSLREVAS